MTELADRLAALPPVQLSVSKRLLNQSFSVSMPEALEFEDVAQVMNFQSADTAEAVAGVRAEAHAELHRPLTRRARAVTAGCGRVARSDALAARLGPAGGVPVGRGDPQHERVVGFPLGAARRAGQQERAARVGLGLDRRPVVGASVEVHERSVDRR